MNEYIWGRNSINEAIKNNRIIEAYVLSDSPYIETLKKKNIPFKIRKRFELDKMSHNENHQGIIGVIEGYELSSVDDMIKKENGLIVMLDSLEDPHNLGAIMRSVDCVGADGIIYRKHHGVRLNSTVAKVASGAMEYVKVAEVTNLVKTLQDLKKKGYWVVGTDASAKDMYNKIDYRMNTVLVIGSEGKGISRLVLEECDYVVKLPMFGHVNSLNASVATAIMLYKIIENRE
ncbi:MAG: 23S rRNA (guanosine(2251)-2'-O)-methyltransferase RlmB [Erysipelotrichaceae bacterium]|nr:23S rRNA (guanosine(2251)-2'-O)-methyltransferase RlmB [Bacillota bacterium]MDY3092310.1 23S rRNA (guanosine(2251)-2'-O)-methyltransferase RlmB [Erysipelotrichaceae bacterium]